VLAGIVVALGKMIYEIIITWIILKKTKEFFEKYRTEYGIVRNYEIQKGRSYTTYEFQGKYKPSRPEHHYIPDQCYIEVECHYQDQHYLALYRIKKDEYMVLYRKYDVGSTITIHPDWIGIAYRIM
jgi:hypothetical protein